MEMAIYNDFAPRKWKPKKKLEAGALKVEQTTEWASQKLSIFGFDLSPYPLGNDRGGIPRSGGCTPIPGRQPM
jgi:hypothetical protein